MPADAEHAGRATDKAADPANPAAGPADPPAGSAPLAERFAALWRTLAPIGRDPDTGGYTRYAWSAEDLACRDWFGKQCADRDLPIESDGNGNLYAWWGEPGAGDAVLVGSHFDSVPQGGGYDGPLGIASALLAIDLLRERGVRPRRPIGIAVFAEEEGSRFGIACLGSRLLTGVIAPERAAALTDRDGTSLATAMQAAGVNPGSLGPGPDRLARIAHYVELHIEQGRHLVDLDAPVGVATAIWPHGRWRFDFTGEGNHAGTTRMADRRDPMLTFAYTVLAANKEARLRGGHATVGRVSITPNATNAIPPAVTAWLDARAPDQATLDGLVADIAQRVRERAGRDRTGVTMTMESVTPVTEFSAPLRDRLVRVLGGVPVLPTGAGHDAGILAPHVDTAMLFVRNPTGVSHAPGEHASDADAAAGVRAVADVIEELACH